MQLAWQAPRFFTLAWLPGGTAGAQTDKELRDQRSASQKERTEKKRQRDREMADASRNLRETARELDTGYREKLRQVDVEFELKRVELEAGHKAKVAAAETEFMKKLSVAMRASENQDMQQRIAQLEVEMKAMSAELFRLKEEAAAIEHKERMAIEARKHEQLAEPATQDEGNRTTRGAQETRERPKLTMMLRKGFCFSSPPSEPNLDSSKPTPTRSSTALASR